MPRTSSGRRRGLTTRVALLVGFGGLLALLALSGMDAALVLSQIQTRNTAIRRAYVERSRRLEQIRAMLYLSGTYVRDYLLEPDAALAEASRASLAATRRQIEGGLASYGQRLQRDERQPFEGLRQELDAYWRSLDPVLTWGSLQRRQQGYAFLRAVVYPRRTQMLHLADLIAAANDRLLERGDQELARLFGGFRLRLAATLAATLLLGALVAAASMRRILHLEAQTTGHLAALTQARREGQELSARLVETQESERRALARELHDAVGQSLSAVLMELRNLGAVLPPGTGEPRRHADTIRRLVEGAVEMVRNMALMLRPSMLDDLGLVPALEWQAREVSRRTGMSVTVTAADLPDDLPDEHRTAVYRMAQEALANAARHAQARSVTIKLALAGSKLRLDVRDDGRGFDAARGRGMGLLGIQERAANLGGALTVESAPARGTLLTVTLPLRHPASAPKAATQAAAGDTAAKAAAGDTAAKDVATTAGAGSRVP